MIAQAVITILGTGKTHTMLGTDEDPGIMVRALNDLLLLFPRYREDAHHVGDSRRSGDHGACTQRPLTIVPYVQGRHTPCWGRTKIRGSWCVHSTTSYYCSLGTGKTHTMLGTDEDPGIMVRALNDLLLLFLRYREDTHHVGDGRGSGDHGACTKRSLPGDGTHSREARVQSDHVLPRGE